MFSRASYLILSAAALHGASAQQTTCDAAQLAATTRIVNDLCCHGTTCAGVPTECDTNCAPTFMWYVIPPPSPLPHLRMLLTERLCLQALLSLLCVPSPLSPPSCFPTFASAHTRGCPHLSAPC